MSIAKQHQQPQKRFYFLDGIFVCVFGAGCYASLINGSAHQITKRLHIKKGRSVDDLLLSLNSKAFYDHLLYRNLGTEKLGPFMLILLAGQISFSISCFLDRPIRITHKRPYFLPFSPLRCSGQGFLLVYLLRPEQTSGRKEGYDLRVHHERDD